MTATRPMTADDLFRLRFLNGGRLSPDGGSVVYPVISFDTDADKELSTLHLRDLATGATKQLTAGQSRDSNPVWSPDGKRIAFVSDRGEKAQVYLLPVDGGEARQLTDLAGGVGGGLAFSPDGSWIACCGRAKDAASELATQPYRVDRTVYRFDAIGYLDQRAQDIFLFDAQTGGSRQLTDDRSNNLNPRFSPDGKSILYDASMQPDAIRTITPDLMLTDLAGGSTALLSGWASVSSASFTPDGKRVVFVGRPLDGKPIGAKSDLYTLDISNGELRNRSAGLDVGVGGRLSLDMPVSGLDAGNLLISDAGDFAIATVQAGGRNHIYRFALDGEAEWQALTHGESCDFALDFKGERLLYASTWLNAPPDLRLLDLKSGQEQGISQLNDDFLAGLALPATERLTWLSVDGVEVEGWHMRPATGSAPYPTILYIHGGPHAAYGYGFHFDFQMLAGAGYGVLFLNHRASTGYGDSFSTAIKGDWGNLDYHDLISGVDHAIALGLADADRLGVCGTSGGGNLSCWIVGQTDRFKAAIPQNPVANWHSFYGTSDIGIYFAVEQLGGHPHEIPEVYTRCSPITYAHRCVTPTLLVQSELDWRCPAEQSEQFYSVLKANGCVVEMLRQPGGSHGASISGALNLRRAHNDAMLDWFARYVLAD